MGQTSSRSRPTKQAIGCDNGWGHRDRLWPAVTGLGHVPLKRRRTMRVYGARAAWFDQRVNELLGMGRTSTLPGVCAAAR